MATKKSKQPEKIYAQASPKSLGGVSLFDVGNQINSSTVPNFQSDTGLIQQSVIALKQAGFEVLQATKFTINFSGTQKQFEKAFKTKLGKKEREYTVPSDPKQKMKTHYWDCAKTELDGLVLTQGTDFEYLLEGVAIEEPVILFENPFPPPLPYWHLKVPGDVS